MTDSRMSWLEKHYDHPTPEQVLAAKSLDKIDELGVECGCEYGETPPDGYFPWPGDDTPGIPKGTMLPAYVPVIKTCRKCELRGLLWQIYDPSDAVGSFT